MQWHDVHKMFHEIHIAAMSRRGVTKQAVLPHNSTLFPQHVFYALFFSVSTIFPLDSDHIHKQY